MAPAQDCRILTAVAIDHHKSSQAVVRWAVDNILSAAAKCILVHVKTLDAHAYDAGGAARRGASAPTDNEAKRLFLPYRGLCARKGIDAKEVVLHDLDIASALIGLINANTICNIVVGASNRSPLTKRFRPPDVPSSLNKSAPDFCSVYTIGKGKVHHVRPASRNTNLRSTDRSLEMHGGANRCPISSTKSPSPPTSMDKVPKPGNPAYQGFSSDASFSGPLSFRSLGTASDSQEFSNPSDAFKTNASMELEAEMTRLKLELKQTMELYSVACKDAATSKELPREAPPSEEARSGDRPEKSRGAPAGEVKERARGGQFTRYRHYTIVDIEVATDYFSTSLKIGEGGFGPVYKAFIDHTPVAIKVLRPDVSQGRKQFEQEVEVLSCMRHPSMVLLLGACPEYGCLVYEYMDNGSLEDRLFRKGGTPPIPWPARFRIAAEIATALRFLHQARPDPVVHRDLKPANILLDHNYCSKIGDVGLARLVPPSVADRVTRCHVTAAAGTFFYIDPEYQQTGVLGVKSDLYSLGVVLLQLLTAMPPMGLALRTERAIQGGAFDEVLDRSVSGCPVKGALAMAKLALKCCEMRKKDRPDLGAVVLPELLRLRDMGMG